APNYDALITPEVMTSRGVQLNLLFRYLTYNSSGDINLSGMPDDQGYRKYKNEILNNPNPLIPNQYFTDLRHTSNDRGFLSLSNTTSFDPEWSSNLNVNLVSDPNYFTDFYPLYMSATGGMTPDQLLNHVDLQYAGVHWQGVLLAQAYQTLHNI